MILVHYVCLRRKTFAFLLFIRIYIFLTFLDVLITNYILLRTIVSITRFPTVAENFRAEAPSEQPKKLELSKMYETPEAETGSKHKSNLYKNMNRQALPRKKRFFSLRRGAMTFANRKKKTVAAMLQLENDIGDNKDPIWDFFVIVNIFICFFIAYYIS